MRLFECKRCGESAGRRMLACSVRQFGSCPYRTVISAIPCEKEDYNSLLLILLVSGFLIWIYPTSLGNDSFFGAAMNLASLGLLVLIFCLVAAALLIITFGQQATIASRERGELWQSRSFRGYEYYLRIISEMRLVATPPQVELAARQIAYLSAVEREKLQAYVNNRARPEALTEAQVITLFSEILEALVFRLLALNLITLKQGHVYLSYWKKVEEHSDTRTYFLALNSEQSQNNDQLSSLESHVLHRLQHWHSKDQESENFLAPDLREFPTMLSDEPSLKEIAKTLLRLSDFNLSGLISRAEFFSIVQECAPQLAIDLRREAQTIFFQSGSSSLRSWITRLGLRLKRKQVRVGIVAASLLVFFFLRFSTPVRHASKFTEAVKNMDLDQEAPGVLDDLGRGAESISDRVVGNNFFERLWERIKNQIPGMQSLVESEYQATAQDLKQLLSRVDDATTSYKLMVLDRLAEYQGNLEDFQSQIRSLLKDKSAQVQLKALEVLSKLEDKAAGSLDEVVGLLDSPDEAVQKAALATLGSMGPSADSAIPQILSLGMRSEGALMPYAAQALQGINTPAAQNALRSLRLR